MGCLQEGLEGLHTPVTTLSPLPIVSPPPRPKALCFTPGITACFSVIRFKRKLICFLNLFSIRVESLGEMRMSSFEEEETIPLDFLCKGYSESELNSPPGLILHCLNIRGLDFVVRYIRKWRLGPLGSLLPGKRCCLTWA